MACCALGLLLVCQVFEAWRRVRLWLGMSARAFARAESAAQHLHGRLLAVLRRPWIRAGLALLLSAELSFAGGLLYDHRDHFLQEVSAVGSFLGDSPDICITPAATDVATSSFGTTTAPNR